MQQTTVGPGVCLAYDLSEVRSRGRPVVLVHGWCGDRTYLEPQQAHLSRNRTVVALDLRGHGQSDPAPDGRYGIEDFADDVVAVATERALDSPVVVGHSMGGLVALECAARGVASAAILLDPAPILDARGKAYFLRSADAVAEDVDGAWRRRFAERIMLPSDTARRDEIIAGMPLTDRRIAAAAMRGMGDYDAATALGRVRVPVLVISAAHPEDLGPVRALCPTLVTGQTVGAGHFHQLEVPEQVNPMIDRFLALAGL
jgi:pimeloyl-ACP methyl ester carboxylesterase